MRFLICDRIKDVSAEELSADLLLLPDWRRAAAEKYRFFSGRVQSAKAYLLLRQALFEEYGLRDDSEFAYGERGKPFLAGHPDIFFKLSHCREAVMCVVDDRSVGCDIESIERKPDLSLLEKTMSPKEQERVCAAPSPEIEFMKLWTAKEAVLKQRGTGLVDDLADLLAGAADEGLVIKTTPVPEKGYVFSICH